jgi:hypothetical protein
VIDVGIGVSIFLVAVGAVLAFAVEVSTRGIDLNTVGVILMLVGVVGLLFSLMWWSEWSPWSRTRYRTTEYVDRPRDVVREREVVERHEAY